MRILFLRHAAAVEADIFPGHDMQRPLTARGRKEAARMGDYLRALKLKPEVILTSPAVRAIETARYAFGRDRADIDSRLAPGATVTTFRRIIREYRSREVLLLVGHEPDFSSAIGALIGSNAVAIKLSKGACACLKRDDDGRFELRWLIGPGQLPRIGNRK